MYVCVRVYMHVFLSGKQAQNLLQILKEVQNCCKDKKPQSRAVFPQKNGVPSSTLDQGTGPAIWTGNKYPVVLTYSQGRQNAVRRRSYLIFYGLTSVKLLIKQ